MGINDESRLSYLEIPSLDVRRSAAFYENVVGWNVQGQDTDHPKFSDATGHLIGRWLTGREISREPGLLPYIYVDHIDEVVGLVESNRGRSGQAPYPEGNLLVATVRDPSGNFIGLWEEGYSMIHVNLGNSGLKVSRLCLGCMSFGVPQRGMHAWTLDEAASRPIIKLALESGINFFDTSNSYSDGTSEEITGRALRDFARRDEVVIATKVFFSARNDPNARGLSRKAIMTEIDGSLRRLGTDYVDLYQIHRWDDNTPDRGNARGASRRRQSGQGPVPRRVVHVCLAVLQSLARGRPPRLDTVRLDAEPLQPPLPRGGAGDDGPLHR